MKNIAEYLEEITIKSIDMNQVKHVEELIGKELPEIIKQILSTNIDPVPLEDDMVLLSYDQIIHSESYYGYDFLVNGMLPLIDLFENDYVVYLINENKYGKYNTIMEMLYDSNETLLGIMDNR